MLNAKAIAVAVVIACFASCSRQNTPSKNPVNISAAASLTDVMGEIAGLYRQQTGAVVEFSLLRLRSLPGR